MLNHGRTGSQLKLLVTVNIAVSSTCPAIDVLLQGASYKRTFKAEPAPPHLITHLHQAHLGSLAEGSEEGSDCVSEPESGLIDDEDVEPDAASPAAAPSKQVASQDQSDAQGSTHRNSQVHRQAAFETDGMVELNMDDDLEAPSQGPSFSERAGRQHSGVQHTVQQAQHVEKRGRGAALAATHSSNAAVAVPESDQLHEPTRAGLPAADRAAAYQANAVHAAKGVPASSSAITETDPSAIDTQSGRVKSQPSAVNPLAASDTAGTDAAATPAVTGPAAAGPAAAADAATDSLDFQDIALDEVQLSPSTVSKAAEVAAAAAPSRLPGSVQDEWEEVNLARAREVAATVDTAPNPIPGDKVLLATSSNPAVNALYCMPAKKFQQGKDVQKRVFQTT